MKREASLPLSLGAAADGLASGEHSAVELTEGCLARIEALDGQLGAFLQVDGEGAQEMARRADARRSAGAPRSPLDGVPIALKDNLLTEGLATTAASRMLEGYRPAYDATVVRRLKDAGAVLLGKLNCDEFAMGSSNENSAYGVCRNPWDLHRSPGGSSGGSAASVAAGECFGSLGTDTGGSIRQPAAFCGVVGLKPTYGRVSRFGVVAFASSLDQVGPMSRDVRGCAMLLDAIAGHDPRDATSLPGDIPAFAGACEAAAAGLRVGLPRAALEGEGVDPAVRGAIDEAARVLAARGATVVDVELPHGDYAVATYYIVASSEAASNLARYDGVRFGPRRAEGQGLQAMYEQTRGQGFGDEVKRRILLGNHVLSHGYYDAYYLRAQKVRRCIAEDFREAFARVDLILSPTTPTPAFALGERTHDPLAMYLSDVFTIQANLAGLPALHLPTALSDEGLPVGVQLIGPAFAEETLFQAASCLEQELSFVAQVPPLWAPRDEEPPKA